MLSNEIKFQMWDNNCELLFQIIFESSVPHQKDKQDLDPHQSEKRDPDPKSLAWSRSPKETICRKWLGF